MSDGTKFAGNEKFAAVIRLDEVWFRSHVAGAIAEAVERKLIARSPERGDTRAGQQGRQRQAQGGGGAGQHGGVRSGGC